MTNLDSILKSRDIILPTKSIYSNLYRRQWHPTPVILPGKFHGCRSLVGCSPWGREVLDTTERLPFHFSLSCIGEGNGNPLQYCLENPMDRGAWQATFHGVARLGHVLVTKLSHGFSNSHVWMWELDYKEGSMLKNWCFWTVMLEQTWESLGLQGDPTSPS